MYNYFNMTRFKSFNKFLYISDLSSKDPEFVESEILDFPELIIFFLIFVFLIEFYKCL